MSAARLLLAAAASALAAFALLTVYATADNPARWDRWLFRQLYSGESDWGGHRAPGQDNPSLNAAEPILYRLADARTLGLLAAAALVITLVLMKRKRSAAFFAAAVSVAALVPVLKAARRPSFPFPDAG